MKEQTIEWTKPKLVKFKRAYTKASRESSGIFKFMGQSFVICYATCLIEYLESRLK